MKGNDSKMSTPIQEKRKVYLTAFQLERCLFCDSPVDHYKMRLKKGPVSFIETQHCKNCETFYLLCYQRNVDLMRYNFDSIDATALQRHVREYNRYFKLKKEKATKSMVFAFLLINRTDAKIYTIVTDYKARDHENRILHYTELEARKIMTSYFFGSGLYTIDGSDCHIQLYEKSYDDQRSFKILSPNNELCVRKGNGGGYYVPGGNKPMEALLYCSNTQCLEVASVTYDVAERVYLMDSTIYRRLVKQFGFPICDYVSMDRNGYSELNEESRLHTLGYNVSDSDGMSDAERQSLLANLVELGMLKVPEIVNHLDFLMRLNNGRSPKSIRRWNADKQFIENYRIDHNRFAIFEKIRTSNRTYKLR